VQDETQYRGAFATSATSQLIKGQTLSLEYDQRELCTASQTKPPHPRRAEFAHQQLDHYDPR